MCFLAWPNSLHVYFKRSDSVTIYLATLSLCRNITCLSCVCLSLCSSRHFCDRTNSLHLILQIFRKSLLNRSHLMLGDILMPRHLSASKNFFLRPVSHITRRSATCIVVKIKVILHVILDHASFQFCSIPYCRCVYVERVDQSFY